MLRFIWEDEYSKADAKAWASFVNRKSVGWNEPGRSALDAARKFLRAALRLEALGRPRVSACTSVVLCKRPALHMVVLTR